MTEWLKRSWAWLMGVALIVTAAVMWHRYSMTKLRDAKGFAESAGHIRELRAERKALDAFAAEESEAIVILDEKIAEHRARAVTAFKVPGEITDEELESALRAVLR